MLHSAASDLGLHCLQRPICPDIYSYYGTFFCLFQNILCVVFITCLFDEEFEINKVQNKKSRCFSVKKKKEILCVIEVAPMKLILLCI